VSATSPAVRSRRLGVVLGELEALAEQVAREDLPELFAGLERVRWTAELRLSIPPAGAIDESPRPLMTAKQLADLLVVSTAEVYRLAKGELRSAAVEVGAGALRFDPRRIEQFLEARRRG